MMGRKQSMAMKELMGRKKKRESTLQFLGRKTKRFASNLGRNTLNYVGEKLEDPRTYVTAAQLAATLL